MIKIAWARFVDGQDPATIQWHDIKDLEGYPDAPSERYTMLAPSQSWYPTSGTGKILHAWEAQNAGKQARGRDGYVTHSKPREQYPDSELAWVNIPNDPNEASQTAQPAYNWPASFAAKLQYLKGKSHIEYDEDVDMHLFRWAFTKLRNSKSGPFEAGYNSVSPQSTITIVVGCPVRYNRQSRESLKRTVSRAAGKAGIGMVVPVSVGTVLNAETAEYEVEDTYQQDLTSVYLVTEPNAALLFFLARMLSQATCEDLVSCQRRIQRILLTTQDGTTVILGDVGGGTTDFAAYDLTRVADTLFRCRRVSEPIGKCATCLMAQQSSRLQLCSL